MPWRDSVPCWGTGVVRRCCELRDEVSNAAVPVLLRQRQQRSADGDELADRGNTVYAVPVDNPGPVLRRGDLGRCVMLLQLGGSPIVDGEEAG